MILFLFIMLFFIFYQMVIYPNSVCIKNIEISNKVYYHFEKNTDYISYYSKYNNICLNEWIQKYIKYIN